MDADQIRQLKPMLTRYLKEFDDCFARRDARSHFTTYVNGQLSNLGEKSCEPIALAAAIPPRNLQGFLAFYHWNEDLARQRLQHIVVRDHAAPNTIGVIDETSDAKKGDKTPGVKRQWCGTVGKTEVCIVTVHLAMPPRTVSGSHARFVAINPEDLEPDRIVVATIEDILDSNGDEVDVQDYSLTWEADGTATISTSQRQ